MTDLKFKANVSARFEDFTHDLLKERASRACFLFEHLLFREGAIASNEGKLYLNGRPVEKYASAIAESVFIGTGVSCSFALGNMIAQSSNTAFPDKTAVPERILSACYGGNEAFDGMIAMGTGQQVVSARALHKGEIQAMVIAAIPQASNSSLGRMESDVHLLVEKMESHKSQSLTDFVGSIRSIAKRIHLLALNASILSAQAGEHGRGFAVVAREIGELAEKTKQSTQELEKRFLGPSRLNDVERRTGGRRGA